jgi:hypothetical protein
MGKTLDVYDVEVHPAGRHEGRHDHSDDDVCQALEERATRCEMTVQELLVALGAAGGAWGGDTCSANLTHPRI